MNTVWVLVCDAARGRVFEVRERQPSWHLLETFEHEESRSKARALVSDRSGRSVSRGGSVHHNALAPSSSPKEVECGHFVHTLATMLDRGMRSKRFRRWVLVAPPHVLGILRKELTGELVENLMGTIDKDLSRLPARELAERLRDAVRIPIDQREEVGAIGPPPD